MKKHKKIHLIKPKDASLIGLILQEKDPKQKKKLRKRMTEEGKKELDRCFEGI